MSRFALPQNKPADRPRVLVIGPGPEMIGGVSTFISILLSSPLLEEHYDLIHLDTTRKSKDASSVNRLSLTNLTYLIRQLARMVGIATRRRPAIVHLMVTGGWAFWKINTFLMLAKLYRMKVVAHLHGGSFDEFYRGSRPWMRKFIGWSLNQADIVVALSGRWKRFLLDEVRPDLKIVIVHNTVDSQFATILDNQSPETNKNGNVVLFVGSLGQRKGVYDVLRSVPQVVARHPNVRFLFAGPEERSGERANIDQICANLCLGNEVQFLGSITGEAKINLFREADVFILPSHAENFPYALLEAMSAGLPVVTTPVGAIPEIVVEGHNGFLITPGDDRALACCISHLIENMALREKMSQANKECIRASYLPERAMASFDELYAYLVKPQKPQAFHQG